jgi:hypothetical protein
MIVFIFSVIEFALFAGLALAVLTGPAMCWRREARGHAEERGQAEEKGFALLHAWLTPEQAQQWDSRREFDVVGSDTCTRYRIRYGTAMNVHELDSAGRMVAQWCFAPQGRLVVGDVLLAQKVALETMEREALAAANRQVHLRYSLASEYRSGAPNGDEPGEQALQPGGEQLAGSMLGDAPPGPLPFRRMARR